LLTDQVEGRDESESVTVLRLKLNLAEWQAQWDTEKNERARIAREREVELG